jgi:uncharacterized Zn finger protein (UPF0148 family)
MEKDYSRSISMQCSTCGGAEFEYEDGDGPVRCIVCGHAYTREELMRENGAQIEAEFEEMKDEIAKNIHGKFQNILKNFR